MRYLFVLILLAFLFNSCKDNNPVDPVDSQAGKPTVSIKTPANGFNAVDSVSIEADAADDKGVVKVEIYIDNAAGDFRTFYAKPYKYTWLTNQAADGSTHTLYAKAYDADGNSTTSDVVNITVYRLQPGTFSSTIISDSLVTVKWRDYSTIETGFEIEQRTRNGQFTVIKTAKANDTTANITGPFSADSVYYFRVAAKFNSQNTSYSNIDSVKFSLEPPANLKAVATTDTLISLSWEDNSSNETGFIAEQSSDGVSFSPVKTFPANTKSGSVTGVFLITTTYYFRIKAVSKYNSSSYTSSQLVKIVINPPSDLKITSLSSSSIKLFWKDNCAFDTRVEVERKTNTGDFEVIAKVKPGVDYFIDTALDKSNTYSYRVKAYTKNNSSGYIEIIKINSVAKGYQTFKTFSAGENLNTIALSPDGKFIASGGSGNSVKIRSIKDGETVRILQGFTAPVNYVIYSPDGVLVAACSQDKTIKIWRVADGQLMKDLTSHTASVSSIAFNKEGTLLVSGSYDKKVNLWRVSDGALLKSLSGHSAAVTAVSVSPDGDLIASGSTLEENKIKTWRMIDTSFVRDFPDSSWTANSIGFSPNSRYLAAGYTNGNIILWFATSGTFVENMGGHSSTISNISFSSDGFNLLSSSFDKTVKLWRISDGAVLYTLNGHTDVVKQAVFFSDNKTIASCSFDKSIRLWELTYQWSIAQ